MCQLGKPLFGVCLGLQALAEVFGCTVSHAPTIMHGKTSLVEHIDDEIFAGVANPMTATRYHSLAVEPDTVPDDLVVTAWTKDDHIVQGIKHRSLPMYAVQFHPESVMTAGRLPSACELAEGVRPGERRGTFQGIAAQGRGLRSQQEDVGSAKTHGTSDGTSVET